MLPRFFSKIQGEGAPIYAIYATVGLILIFVLLFDASRIAKLAGAFQLMMFGLSCLAVMVMRESRIESYDPRFRSPFYPWLHILGVLAPFWLIVEMGILPSLFTGGLITFGAMWYNYYARERVGREGAIYHVFERLGRQRDEGLDRELRQIMKEKGLRDADPFEEVVTAAAIIDTLGGTGFRNVIWEASAHLAEGRAESSRMIPAFVLPSTPGYTFWECSRPSGSSLRWESSRVSLPVGSSPSGPCGTITTHGNAWAGRARSTTSSSGWDGSGTRASTGSCGKS